VADEAANELRILQLIPVLAIGGLERVAQRLTLMLAESGEHVAVAAKTGVAERWGGPAIEQPLRAARIPIYRLTRPRPRADLLVRSSFELARVLRRERPDVVHAHNPAAGVAAAIARRLARLPQIAIVTTFHGVLPSRLDRAARALAHGSDLIVGVGPSSTRALVEAGVDEDQTRTIYNGVSVHPARSRESVLHEFGFEVDAELVVTVGRYAPEKNHALLLDALGPLVRERPRLRALLVGAGELQGALTARVTGEGLDSQIIVTGPRPDAVDLIAAADVFALTSSSEALPLVLLEAMLGETAIVATDVGGIRDLIRHDETGLLAPSGDANAVRTAVARLFDDGELRARLVAEAKGFVDSTCSEQAMVDSYRSAYAVALERRRTRAAAPRSGASPSK
jgi:glycosyltransferase involved in cell wall biosynthesis